MKRFASPVSIAATCGLIALANLAILAAARWNRLDGARTELSLTERELALPGARQDEGTALELSLLLTHEPPGAIRRTARWKRYDLPSVDYDWLDRAKLAELRFRVDVDPADPEAEEHYRGVMPRRVYLVLEYDGSAWSRWLAAREDHVRRLRQAVAEGKREPGVLADAEAVLAADRTMRSRLFPVDAGTDADALRRRYGELRDHAVVVGFLRPKVIRPQNGAPTLTGDVLGLAAGRVHVSRDLGSPLEGLLPRENWEEVESRERKEAERGWPSLDPPRYRAALAIGRRHEPWLVDVARIGGDER